MFKVPRHNIPVEIRKHVTDKKIKQAIKGTYKSELSRMKKESGIKKFTPEQNELYSKEVIKRIAEFMSSQFKMPITSKEIQEALK